ncbi:MAG TPA: GTPase Era [Flavobacteriales bacterium]|nr:GTPase Era [Flavobacteriales bacterium]
MNHKAGFVNIVGKPNVGKSTLMNALVGENLSIITAKAQTTRHRIMGIVSGKNFQIVYSDTPGILKPAYKLHKGMMDAVEGSFTDADIVIYVTEPGLGDKIEEETLAKLQKLTVPVIILINKVDTIGNDEAIKLVEDFRKLLPGGLVATISALKKWNIDTVFRKILELLPEGPAFYPDNELSDRSVRFFVAEIIREKILLNYEKEIPYSCEVVIDSYKEEPKIDRIAAIIYVARESQKGIVIGHQGAKLKKVGTEARKSIEEMLEKKVFLELQVKVAKDWREDDKMLRRFGYLKK